MFKLLDYTCRKLLTEGTSEHRFLAIPGSWILASAALLLVATQQPCRAQQLELEGQPLVLIVDRDQASPEPARQRVILHESFKQLRRQIAEQFPDIGVAVPLHWADFLPTNDLRLAGDGPLLSFGPEGSQADILYHFDREPEIGDANRSPGLWLSASDATRLTTGVYTGQLTTQIRTPLLPGYSVRFTWPVVVAVAGERVFNMTFVDDRAESDGTLRFGDRASVEFFIERVEREQAATGRFELTIQPPNADAIQCRLPLPLDTSLDPAIRSAKSTSVPLRWSKEIFRTELLGVSETEDLRPTKHVAPHVRRSVHRMRVVLPSFFTTGSVTARVHWDPAPASGKADKSEHWRSECSAQRQVVAGVRVWPKMAFIGERVSVQMTLPRQAVVPKQAGNQAPLADLPVAVWPVDKDQKEPPVLKLSKEQPADGQMVLYEGELGFPTLGDFHVQPADALVAKLVGKRTIHVVFERRDQLGDPLLIFNDTPPFWWGWFVRDPDLARNGVRVSRRGALDLIDRSGRNREVTLRFRGFTSLGGNLLDEPEELGEAPEFSFVTTDASPQKPEGFPVYQQTDSEEPYPESLRDWSLGDQGVRINLKSDISTPVDGERELLSGPRAAYGKRAYVMRFSIEGRDSNGEAFQRTLLVPFWVEVRSHWYYDQWLAYATGLFLVMIVGLAAYKIRQDRRLARTARHSVGSSPAEDDSKRDSEQEVTSFMPSGSSYPAAAPEAEVQEEPSIDERPGSLLGGSPGLYSDDQDRPGGGLMPG